MKRRFKFDDYEVNIIIKALIELRNQLIAEGRYTDAVDELIIRLVKKSAIITKRINNLHCKNYIKMLI